MTNFALHIHEMVKSMIGILPPHLEFVYGFADCIVIFMIVLVAFSPWIFLYKFLDRW